MPQSQWCVCVVLVVELPSSRLWHWLLLLRRLTGDGIHNLFNANNSGRRKGHEPLLHHSTKRRDILRRANSDRLAPFAKVVFQNSLGLRARDA